MKSKKTQSILLWVVLVFIILVTIATGVFIFAKRVKIQSSAPKITNYQECVAAGNPVTLSYPGTCHTPSGQSFPDTSQVAPGPPPAN